MDLRDQLLQKLVTPQADTRFGDPYLVGTTARETGLQAHEVEEALWALVSDGLVYLSKAGQGSGTDNWRWLASQLGIRVATSGVGAWEPRDPTRYLQRLKKAAPDLDEAAFNYVQEALRAFNARCFLATSVMLGVASEQVFGRLASAFTRPPQRSRPLGQAAVQSEHHVLQTLRRVSQASRTSAEEPTAGSRRRAHA